jgi:hypothetical protein
MPQVMARSVFKQYTITDAEKSTREGARARTHTHIQSRGLQIHEKQIQQRKQ